MLSDHPSSKKLKSPPKRPISAVAHRYSDSQKLEAVKLWLITGNLATTAATLGIPLVTVKSWRYADWWGEIVADIKSENRLSLSTRLKSIAARALDVTVDRLDNGEWFYDQKTGELRRKPVLMKDAHKVASDLLQRQLELERPQETRETNESTEQKLNKLAEVFEQFAKKTKRIEVIDVEPNHAVYEERETGLQEGTGVGAQEEAPETQGSSEESPGSEGDGEGVGEYADGDASGSQETPQVGWFKLSEQLALDNSESEPEQGS